MKTRFAQAAHPPAGARKGGGSAPHARRQLTTTALLAAVVLFLSACVQIPTPTAGEQVPEAQQQKAQEGAPAELNQYYQQVLEWTNCNTKDRCADVKVPLDYDHPSSGSITLSMVKLAATGKSKGALLVNPGGPGGSGFDFVADNGEAVLSKSLRQNYDIIGFDPRGVKRSTPVKCLSDSEMDAARALQFNMRTDAGIEQAAAAQKVINQKCVANSGPVLGHVDTVSAARDLDVLRAVLGQEKLNYLGYSYGTFLGSTYAGLFPDKVGHLVLDGAIDPSMNESQITLGQAAAFEKAMHSFVKWCLERSTCPLDTDETAAVAQIKALFEKYREEPQTANDGRKVGITDFFTGFIVPLYSDTNWPLLERALNSALDDDPTDILMLADFSADRRSDGTYTSNSNSAFTAINCLDYKADPNLTDMKKEREELIKAAPTIGEYMAFGGFNCEGLATQSTRTPAPATYTGSQPIVVIGTTGDPATPYAWAQNLRKQLGNASLVTWEGEGHTAYGRAGGCVTRAVDDYFINNTLPKDGLTCAKTQG